MVALKDQIGETVELETFPKRIISVVPSQTEMLYDLGLESALVGITKFCVHPVHLRSEKEIVGGTKNLHLDAIGDLKPDLIVANKEENTRKDIEALQEKFPVYVSDIESVEDSYAFARDMGELTGKSTESGMLIERLRFGYSELQKIAVGLSSKKALYLIWKDPFMAAGTDTFISKMLEHCGISNVLNQLKSDGLRYPKLTAHEIKNLDPDIVLFSSEPFPFKDDHIRQFENETGLKGLYIDGELFSWYGSRLLHVLKETEAVLHEIDTHSR